jgi:hypothetical protein
VPFFPKRKSSWKDLPTKLIQAVGRIIGMEFWEKAEVEEPLSGEISADALYDLLLRYLEWWRPRLKAMPMELAPQIPAGFGVEMLANLLVRIAILVEDGNMPAIYRKKPEHFGGCMECQLQLLYILELFLDQVEVSLGSVCEEHTFYHHLAASTILLSNEAISSHLAGACYLLVEIPGASKEFAETFMACFEQEIEKELKAGTELSEDSLREMARRAITMAKVMTGAPQPGDPRLN